MKTHLTDGPKPGLSVTDVVGLTIGIVVGAGIFAIPSLVASNSASTTVALSAWVLGGVISLIGALVYAELATTFPHPGGDYHFLQRAYGRRVSFLFGWARMTVIQTGSIAVLSFVFGDYASRVVSFGSQSAMIYAGLAVVALTGLNIAGVRQGVVTQNILTILEVSGLVLVIVVGLSLPPAAAAATDDATRTTSLGLVMVFVLLTYGGWNEAAYISTELRDVKRNMVKALVLSITVVTVLYVTVNWVYLRALGLAGAGQTGQIAADMMQLGLGETGVRVIGILVAIASLTSANASILTGGRSSYAFGRDFRTFNYLGRWSGRGETPVHALVIQGVIALLLVGLGAATRGASIDESALRTIIDYTAPVFWLFFMLAGFALIVLRLREPNVERPFRTPLYPITPLLFCASAGYLLYSSLAYVRTGAMVGVAVLAVGAVVMLLVDTRK
jgi:amino acid transporter